MAIDVEAEIINFRTNKKKNSFSILVNINLKFNNINARDILICIHNNNIVNSFNTFLFTKIYYYYNLSFTNIIYMAIRLLNKY